MRARALALAALLCSAAPAWAAGWAQHRYDADGFAVQTPVEPVVTRGQFKPPTGAPVPQTTYTAQDDGVVYSVAVADFSGTAMGKDTALDLGVKALGAEGQVTVDVTERIDAQYGRDLKIANRDGSQSTAAVFFVNNRLYQLAGKALPPDPKVGSGRAIRFQQSLEFINLGAEARRPENQPDAGQGPNGGLGRRFGGGQGGRRAPPPQAFADCKDKAQGAAVQHTTPRGDVVAATCVQTPQGLAARPLRPPPGAPDGPAPQG